MTAPAISASKPTMAGIRPSPMHNWELCIGLEQAKLQRSGDSAGTIRYANVQMLWWPTLYKLLQHHKRHAILLLWRPGTDTEPAVAPTWHIQVMGWGDVYSGHQAATMGQWVALSHLTSTSSAYAKNSDRTTLGFALPAGKAQVLLSVLRLPEWSPRVLGVRGGWLGESGAPVGYLHMVVKGDYVLPDTATRLRAATAEEAASESEPAQLRRGYCRQLARLLDKRQTAETTGRPLAKRHRPALAAPVYRPRLPTTTSFGPA